MVERAWERSPLVIMTALFEGGPPFQSLTGMPYDWQLGTPGSFPLTQAPSRQWPLCKNRATHAVGPRTIRPWAKSLLVGTVSRRVSARAEWEWFTGRVTS